MKAIRWLLVVGVVLLIAAVAWLWRRQQQTLAELHAAEMRARDESQRLTVEIVRLKKAAEEEQRKLRAELVAVTQNKAPGPSSPPSPPASAPQGQKSGTSSVSASASENADTSAERARLHRRYDPFLLQRNLTEAQRERIIDLWIAQSAARADLQAAVEQLGARGHTDEVEAIRSKLYAPITRELREILGDDGYAAYGKYEVMSFYRVAFVEPMQAKFAAAGAPLSADQNEQLVSLLAANNRPRQMKSTDIGSQTQIDWAAVTREAAAFLSPAQLAVVQEGAKRDAVR